MTADPLVDLSVDSEDWVPAVRNPEAFDSFFRREFRLLVGLAYALSGSRVAAEDIAQEALLAAYRRWDEVGILDSPGGWVRRVVANQSVSSIRRRMSEAKGLTRLRMRSESVAWQEMPSDSEWIWSRVRRLPKRQAQVVALRYFGGLSMPEIAYVLGISKESVNTHLRRARDRLAGQLERGGPS
jgi:RNA polymerase sigma-70 factor (ECF subfamily)